jgi:ribosomal protein L7/L12
MGITTLDYSLLHLITAVIVGFIAGRIVGLNVPKSPRAASGQRDERESLRSAEANLDRLPVRVRMAVEALLAEGRIIEAVRDVRAATSLGLKEAKDVVDLMREQGPPTGGARLH